MQTANLLTTVVKTEGEVGGSAARGQRLAVLRHTSLSELHCCSALSCSLWVLCCARGDAFSQ